MPKEAACLVDRRKRRQAGCELPSSTGPPMGRIRRPDANLLL